MLVYTSDGQPIRYDPSQSIGKGGEADVYDVGNGMALKIYKDPKHPDYTGKPHDQEGARDRLAIQQVKLREFPTNLPSHVIVPVSLAMDKRGRIVGYQMRFLRGAEVLLRLTDKTFRQAGYPNQDVSTVFLNLRETVQGVHNAGVVIGDFNDLNVLFIGTEAWIIDADSFQFGRYLSHSFTTKFGDPLLMRETTDEERAAGMGSMTLFKPHNALSDWYAYSMMYWESLLFVAPYGGVYAPKQATDRMPHTLRPLRRISVLHPEVRYPKAATPYRVLPDDMLHWYHLLLEKDKREEFPLSFLQELRWTKCSTCSTIHARSICPNCTTAAPAAVTAVTTVRGNVVATRVFQTRGRILYAAMQEGTLYWLYHEEGAFKRESGSTVMSGSPDPLMRFRLQKEKTLIGKNDRVFTFSQTPPPERFQTETFGNLPMFDANGQRRFWIEQGRLMTDGDAVGNFSVPPRFIGNVLSNQTLFWVGSTFGFGYYRAGEVSVAFVFEANRSGINDSVELRIQGQVIDSTCVFTSSRAWFFYTSRQGGKTMNHCFVIRQDGKVEASASADEHDGSWLGTIRGKAATGGYLFSPTDTGIIRHEVVNGQITNQTVYPNTEPFVDASSHLFIGPNGLYVVTGKEVRMLKIS